MLTKGPPGGPVPRRRVRAVVREGPAAATGSRGPGPAARERGPSGADRPGGARARRFGRCARSGPPGCPKGNPRTGPRTGRGAPGRKPGRPVPRVQRTGVHLGFTCRREMNPGVRTTRRSECGAVAVPRASTAGKGHHAANERAAADHRPRQGRLLRAARRGAHPLRHIGAGGEGRGLAGRAGRGVGAGTAALRARRGLAAQRPGAAVPVADLRRPAQPDRAQQGLRLAERRPDRAAPVSYTHL